MNHKQQQVGTLYLVATPLGNLEDFSHRAVKVLKAVSLVLAEDTRKFEILAHHYGIRVPTWSLHEHNERHRLDCLIKRLTGGENLALVSEAGTPAMSDPGFLLIRECRRRGIAVSPIPGACAAVAAITASGFECERFQFEGFFPRKGRRRVELIAEAVARDCATVFYESPFRVLKTLEEIATLDPDREICVAREMTKLHEEFLSGPVSTILATLRERGTLRGEFTIVIRRGKTQTLPQSANSEGYEAPFEEEPSPEHRCPHRCKAR